MLSSACMKHTVVATGLVYSISAPLCLICPCIRVAVCVHICKVYVHLC
jgi:hypothetical protein